MKTIRALLPVVVLLAACSNPTGQSNAQTAASGPVPDMPQPTRRVPADAASMKLSFSPVVKKAAPAVVNVASRRVVQRRVDPFWDFFMGGGGQGGSQRLKHHDARALAANVAVGTSVERLAPAVG